MEIIKQLAREHMRLDIPAFAPGDTVRVHVKIKEGDKERIQVFTGVVMKMRNGGLEQTFTVRRIVANEGVERIVPLNRDRKSVV